MSDEGERANIVHRLRMAGWDRWDAINEADRKMTERMIRAPVFQRCHCGLMEGTCTCKGESSTRTKVLR